MIKKRSVISSLESYLPKRVMSNYELMGIVDTTHEWIYERTGISNRHVVESGECTHDIAAKAALKALETEGIDASEVDAIILATTTSETRCPSGASRVQSIIGANNAFAFDVQAACSGFIYALATADSFIKSGVAEKVLLIGADAMTRFTDWSDRSTCILLGDGAGSCIVKSANTDESGILDTKLYSDGSKNDLIVIENSEKNNHRGHMTMQGRAVFKYAIECMYSSMENILQKNGMSFDDIDWIVPHQANRRILESMSKLKSVPMDKMIITIENHANTSSASIPLAIKESMDNKIIKKGDTILMTAIGAGLVWGSSIIRL